MGGSVHGGGRSFLLLCTVLGDTYPQKHTVKHSIASSNTEKYDTFNKCSGPGPFFGRKKTPEAAAGHDALVLRTKTLLASMAHERTDRTSRRAEIPPPEEAARPPAVFSGRKMGLGLNTCQKYRIFRCLSSRPSVLLCVFEGRYHQVL